MSDLVKNLSTYTLGLVVYTYEDLIKRGKSLSVLIRRIRQVFPELDLDQVLIQHNTNLMEKVDFKDLQAGLESGMYTRFQIESGPGDDDQPSGLLRAFLGGAQLQPTEPSYFFFGIPALYYAENQESIHSRLITIGREAFDFLNGVYGFAHLGFLDLEENITLSDCENPFAIPPTDFRDLYIPFDLRTEIPYLFWANWLGRIQVDRLGGQEIIQKNIPKANIDRISRGALLITSYTTPLNLRQEVAEEDLKALGSYLVTPHTNFEVENFENISEQENPLQTNEKEQNQEDLNHQIAQALERMTMHVERFEKDYLQNEKAPRNYVWRPYRFCSQDVVLGLTVVRHSVDNNCLEIDVCLAAELPEFEEDSSARVMWSFLLSEAFKCGGTMELRFSENVEGGYVPKNLNTFALKNGISLEHIEEGRVTSLEARHVYLAITQFKPKLRDQILLLASEGRLSPERACYAAHRGLWTQPELAQIVLGSPRADHILSGETLPENRLLYQDDIVHARSALLGGFLDRKLLNEFELILGKLLIGKMISYLLK